MPPPRRAAPWAACALVLLAVLLGGGAPLAQEYTIGPGDILKITVWGHEDLSKDYPVTLDGRVPFPLIGSVQAAGLTTSQLAARLRDLLEKDYLVNPQVIVAVREYLSSKVHVMGEAEKPGLFYLTGPTTLLEILSKAGGLSRTAWSWSAPRPARRAPRRPPAPSCCASTCERSRPATSRRTSSCRTGT
jgi:protein involved in polysaccharide export with SLBB domain